MSEVLSWKDKNRILERLLHLGYGMGNQVGREIVHEAKRHFLPSYPNFCGCGECVATVRGLLPSDPIPYRPEWHEEEGRYRNRLSKEGQG